MRATQKIAGIAAGLGIAAGSLLASSTPAQAYVNDDLTIKTVSVNPDPVFSCDSFGDLTVTEKENGCYVGDSVDGTLFKWDDTDGFDEYDAYKAQIYKGNTMVAKVEWHPYGEKLWVYDTANDGDSIYVSWSFENPDRDNHVISAKPSSDKIDYNVADLDVAEGKQVVLYVWDGSKPANNGGSYDIGYDELDAAGNLVNA